MLMVALALRGFDQLMSSGSNANTLPVDFFPRLRSPVNSYLLSNPDVPFIVVFWLISQVLDHITGVSPINGADEQSCSTSYRRDLGNWNAIHIS